MRDETQQLLSSFESIPWFEKVGIPADTRAIQISSWMVASIEAGADQRKEMASRMANQVAFSVRSVSPERFGQWNSVPSLVRPVISSLVGRLISALNLDLDSSKTLSDMMKWNIMHWVIETEYADIVPPSYFTALGEIYKTGRFPCGWKGPPWPNGMPIVY